MATGDAIFCKECSAVFSFKSEVMKNSENKQIWECEFCMHQNEIRIEDEEKPTESTTNYLLEAAPVKEEAKRDGDTKMEEEKGA